MKKLLAASLLASIVGTASATPSMRVPPRPVYHNNGYSVGYHNGKHDAYNNVARTAVIVGMVAIATVVVYQLGKESRWTANENGVAYRF